MKFNNIEIDVFGSSHSESIGVNVKGFKKGFKVDLPKLQAFVNRRKASNNAFSTSRIEPDEIIVDKGIENGVITGDVQLSIKNTNTRSNDYSELFYIPRPSHADYPAKLKYGLEYDTVGGGKFSGRMTAPLCIAGGIAKQILESKGIMVNAYISQIGDIKTLSYEDKTFSSQELEDVSKKVIPVFNREEEIQDLFTKLKQNKDSIGGKIECVIRGVKGGIGGELFDGIEGKLSMFAFSIPSVKAVEFGIGTRFASSTGSKVNDGYKFVNDEVKLVTNNNGGIVGGITIGEDILIRLTLKPTPSIASKQQSVNLKTRENVELEIKGRHDVCHTPRAVPVVEAVMCLGLLDIIGE